MVPTSNAMFTVQPVFCLVKKTQSDSQIVRYSQIWSDTVRYILIWNLNLICTHFVGTTNMYLPKVWANYKSRSEVMSTSNDDGQVEQRLKRRRATNPEMSSENIFGFLVPLFVGLGCESGSNDPSMTGDRSRLHLQMPQRQDIDGATLRRLSPV